MTRKRLAIVVSHPIQYYAPYYRALAASGKLDIRAFFCSRIGTETMLDPGMGVELAWRTDLLAGYEHEFLPGADRVRATTFAAVDNPEVGSRLRAFRPDIILQHGYAQKTLLRSLAWARLNRVPSMIVSDRSRFGPSTRARRLARRVVSPVVLKQFSAFLAIGDSVRDFYRAFGVPDERIFHVPTMLDEGFWQQRDRARANRSEIRARFGFGDDFVVLFVGKLIARKRPHDLISALEILQARRGDHRAVSVLFVGDGAMRPELEARVASSGARARFAGFVNIDKLPCYYAAGDALAHPAEYESFGIIAVEAAVYGLPLVLSDRVGAIGATSIARPGENSIVHPCRDTAAVADALALLADRKDVADRMSAASTRFARDHEGPTSVRNTLAAIECCLRNQAAIVRRSGHG